MIRGPIKVTRLKGEPAELGTRHGELHGAAIREYTAERVRLSHSGTWSGREAAAADVLALAEAMLPAHQRYAPDLYEEMAAMASAAGISTAEAVIVGGFTDFIDAVRAASGPAIEEETCTSLIVPDVATLQGGFLAQTWDMHDTSEPYVIMLHLMATGHPRALVFTTAGCLGQMGMNEAGIAVGINNLTSADGRVGVTWPFVVRKVLQQTHLENALTCVVEAELAGGHNFLLFDSRGEGFNVEAMPSGHHVTKLGDEPLVHTNHTLHPNTTEWQAPRPADLLASSELRLLTATEILEQRPVTEKLIEELTKEPGAICRPGAAPYHVATCGAAIMRPKTGDLWAVWGLPSANPYQHFTI